MSSKRYQNVQKGYSRRQQKAMTVVAIDEELSLDEPIPAARFEPDSIVALMVSAPPAAEVTTPQSAAVTAAPPPEAAAVTEVKRGAMAEVEHPTNARIRAFDRLMALIRRAR